MACSAPRVPPSLNRLYTLRGSPRHVFTPCSVFGLVMHTPLIASRSSEFGHLSAYSIHGYMPVGTLAAHPQAVVLPCPRRAAQPAPRGTCSHSAPSLSASLKDALDPACSVISALLYTPMRTHSQAAVVPPTQLPMHSLKHLPLEPLLACR